MSTVPGCGAHCLQCTAVGDSVKCTPGMCENEYALNDEATDINSACVGKTSRRLPFHTFSRLWRLFVITTTTTTTTPVALPNAA